MNLFARSRASHVLAWMPPYLTDQGRPGWWDLQTRAAYEAAQPQTDPAWSTAHPRNASADVLAGWAAHRLGYPVTMTRRSMLIRPSRSLRLPRLEPIYYVRQAAERAADRPGPHSHGGPEVGAAMAWKRRSRRNLTRKQKRAIFAAAAALSPVIVTVVLLHLGYRGWFAGGTGGLLLGLLVQPAVERIRHKAALRLIRVVRWLERKPAARGNPRGRMP